jgi:cytochrome c-type biogenesis protein CcmH/NrfG
MVAKPLGVRQQCTTNNTIAIKQQVRIKKRAKEILSITSAIVGLIVTVDAYCYSGVYVTHQREQQIEMLEELKKTHQKMIILIEDLDDKIDHNAHEIQQLEKEIDELYSSRD